MTYEEMIKLTETNNEMIEKLSLQNKWIARQYMETMMAEFVKHKIVNVIDEYIEKQEDDSSCGCGCEDD